MTTTSVGPFQTSGGAVQPVTIQLRTQDTNTGLLFGTVEQVEIQEHHVLVRWTQTSSGNVNTVVVPWSNIVAISQVVNGA